MNHRGSTGSEPARQLARGPLGGGGAGRRVDLETILAPAWGYVDPSWGYVDPSWGYVGPATEAGKEL